MITQILVIIVVILVYLSILSDTTDTTKINELDTHTPGLSEPPIKSRMKHNNIDCHSNIDSNNTNELRMFKMMDTQGETIQTQGCLCTQGLV